MHYLVGLDIGSHTIKAAVAEYSGEERPSLIALLTVPSGGIRRGTVENITDATQAVSGILEEIKQISRGAIKNIVLGVASPDVRVQHSRGVVAVSRADDQIYEDDLARVKQSAQALNLPPNRMVLHVIHKEFIVDGVDAISDPIGMIGKRLEVNTLIVDAFSPSVKNLQKAVETLGGGVEGSVLSPLASGRAVLTKHQRELGVALIDIGFSKTCLSIYEEDQLIHAAVIPVGSGNITNDLAIGLRIPIEAAETIKLSYGSAVSKEISARDVVDLVKIDPRAQGTASKKFIVEIIEDRLAEIFELVNTEIKLVGKASQLPAGVVLVGGGTKIPNITELARSELQMAAQIGIPDITRLPAVTGELSIAAEDPEFACAIGLLLYEGQSAKETAVRPSFTLPPTLKKILNYFIP
ncbi:MAG: cell division protein FtsA [Candidatus Harrisonbacteria bacterium CG10_big_fil_rev_8_21_14_0_10_49_15]|uniref:Cell division protein FtsA n=1 Tax=Candidatus Harrisonbacteria bacterium CG10_big_fil_rev_8_21_14_0_10_49_15 TaxID=1974587 RepID=A0A2H0ULP2_9BACT|nr:MAG: cell division protein FtsA [Candidatus Harrisonbacteria bacterium CG10_big_fil_rev_8_21_14_0_10_49_15]